MHNFNLNNSAKVSRRGHDFSASRFNFVGTNRIEMETSRVKQASHELCLTNQRWLGQRGKVSQRHGREFTAATGPGRGPRADKSGAVRAHSATRKTNDWAPNGIAS